MNVSGSMYDAAVTLLRTLSQPHGIRASLSSSANYGAVFTRDAVMAGIAGLLTGDAVISAGLVRTLEQLRDLQGPQGQIASNYTIVDDGPPLASFGTLVPRLDAPLWYVIGIGLSARAGALDPTPFRHSVEVVLQLLDGIEYNGRHLIYVPVGGDWADEYVYEGYVLHDQVLRAWALRLAAETYDEPRWREKSQLIDTAIADNFWPASGNPLRARSHPVAAYTPTRVYEMFDLAACSLLVVSGRRSERATGALDWAIDEYLARRELPPAFHPVIDEGSAHWPALSRYHLHGFRNRPHEYHNGGVWMIWLGWLALALARNGDTSALASLRSSIEGRLATTARLGGYAFEEFFHGASGAVGGTPHMAYSATGIVFAEVADHPATRALLVP